MGLTTKRLAIYLPSLGGGGAERIMVTLANAFAERGIKTDLVLVKAEGPYLNDVSKNVRVVDLGASRVAMSLPLLVHYLRRVRPTSILSALNHANVVALLARRVAGVKTRLVVSERNSLSSSRAHVASFRGRLMALFMRWTYPWADGIVAVSRGVADDLAATISLPRDRIDSIYNPIDMLAIRQRAEEPFDHPWFTPGDPPVILGVGRLTLQKDFPTLLRSFAQLRAQRQARLVILGEGEHRSQLQALVAVLGLTKDVAMPGFTENPFVWMRLASVFVLSSAWEGLPGTLIQAMACGTPVVSTDCQSGPAEILENGKWGRLVPVGDVSALADAIAATLDEKTHPKVQDRASDFSVDKAVDEYLRVLGVGR